MEPTLKTALIDLDRDRVRTLVEARLGQGDEALLLLDECRQALAEVGQRYQQGDYYLSELILAGEILKAVAGQLEPHLIRGQPAAQPAQRGTVVLATLKGDIHDLGKNLFKVLLTAHGYAVHDLGVDVSPERIVPAVRDTRADLVGFSALITSCFDAMHQAVGELRAADLRSRVGLMIGGGVTTPTLRDHLGADFQTTDAMAGVAWCQARRRPSP
jgi:5-methyltetrahydrofolate--homocysteine methyltransferase